MVAHPISPLRHITARLLSGAVYAVCSSGLSRVQSIRNREARVPLILRNLRTVVPCNMNSDRMAPPSTRAVRTDDPLPRENSRSYTL